MIRDPLHETHWSHKGLNQRRRHAPIPDVSLCFLRTRLAATRLDEPKFVKLYTKPHDKLPGHFTVQESPPAPPSRYYDDLGRSSQARPLNPSKGGEHIADVTLTPHVSPRIGIDNQQDQQRWPSACSSCADTFVTANEEARSTASHTPVLSFEQNRECNSDERANSCSNDTPRGRDVSHDHRQDPHIPSRVRHAQSFQDIALSPNVTVRRPRHPRNIMSSPLRPTHNDELGHSDLGNESPRALGDASCVDDYLPVQVNDDLYNRLRDEKSKRLSAISISSTVESALVREALSSPRGKLRHAGKNLALRTDSDTTPRSGHTDSDAAHTHRLKRRRSAEHLRNVSRPDSVSDDLDFSVSSISDTPFSEQQRQALDASAIVFHKFQLRHRQAPSPSPEKANTPAHDSLKRYYSSNEHKRRTNKPAKAQEKENRPPVPLKDDPLGSRHPSPLGSFPVGVRSARQDLTSTPLSESKPLLQSLAAENYLGSNFYRSADFYTVPWSRRGSLGSRPPVLASASPVPSSDTSSQSRFSDRIETLEVRQATAVNISPLRNSSVVVLQQGPRVELEVPTMNVTPASPQRAASLDSPRSARKPVPPSTPSGLSLVLSERNPSVVTLPASFDSQATLYTPKITVCPATPSSEHKVPLFEPVYQELLPTRRTSLVDKARRHSGVLMQAPVGRSSSLRETRAPVTGMRAFCPLHLHPAWHPRIRSGFFKDYNALDWGVKHDLYNALPMLPRRRCSIQRRMSDTLSSIGRAGLGLMESLTNPSVEEVYKPPPQEQTDQSIDPPTQLVQQSSMPARQPSLRRRKSNEGLRHAALMDNQALRPAPEPAHDAACRGFKKQPRVHKIPGLPYGVQFDWHGEHQKQSKLTKHFRP